MAVTLSSSVLDRYRRFSRFNSPYPAHDDGCAIDLYPDSEAGISPVAGVVRETRTVGCPDRPYAADEDHLIVVELDEDWCRRAGAAPGTIARILHVVPEVSAGDRVAVGDALGPLTRSGFFGQWVDNHVHLGFRAPGANALRASGSLPVDVDVSVEPIQWDGTGAVVERGPTHVVLDAPTHPAPGQRFAALASDDGIPLDGGLAHYAGGGAFDELVDGAAVSLWGTRVGVARGRGVAWDPIDVLANGERVVGLSLFAARDDGFGAKIVCPDRRFDLGETVSLALAPSDDPIRLGVG
ncbi:hypothetical protein [Halorubrum lacusprofundi]|jgi:hypothetical protein|uniref:Uncharacterized protein n=1 Tax=Halorubrum lacusprofundi (strain ATCC 49239 / DSM 5036 / JCM 8891 / ACAM 34) TaxID=416348 RepID=B9LR48_HALLT|nr:hypothetical protein [Halorubrum lacusprofundi]ACM57702.1 conserved hypothetical protein [Halorubrum lacusprofundi ATCC 49239]MCG1005701.1 hypothetical protein [Halorubrum lacusprofundi]